jgi:type IV secretion system protein VirB6
MTFLTNTETAITSGFTAVATTFGAGLLATFRPAFIIGFSIWITLIAYEVAFGKAEDGFTYIFTKIGKIFLIGTIALYGWPEVAELLNGIRAGFVGSNTVSTILQTQLINPLAAMWQDLFQWLGAILTPLGFGDLVLVLKTLGIFAVMVLAYFGMSVGVAVFCAVSLAMFLVANSVFILLLAVGPFFLLCLAFPFTQRFFENFIGNVMTSILAMGFTVLMIAFVASFYNLGPTATIINTASAGAIGAFPNEAISLAALFASRAGAILIIIYLYYKVFDLASALGGGLSIGNNMVGGVRNILRDLQRNSGGGARGANSTVNQISQGNSGGGGSARAARGNSTFTGAAIGAASRPVGALGSAAMTGAANIGRIASYGAGRAAGTAGRFAYNRNSQARNRMSSSG